MTKTKNILKSFLRASFLPSYLASIPSSHSLCRFHFNPFILMMYLLNMIPDTWHYVKYSQHYFMQNRTSSKFIVRKEFLKVFIKTSWASWHLWWVLWFAVLCISFGNQINNVQRHSYTVCWVHLLSCSLNCRAYLVRLFCCYSKKNFSWNLLTCICKGLALTNQSFGQEDIGWLWTVIHSFLTYVFFWYVEKKKGKKKRNILFLKTMYVSFCHIHQVFFIIKYCLKVNQNTMTIAQ